MEPLRPRLGQAEPRRRGAQRAALSAAGGQRLRGAGGGRAGALGSAGAGAGAGAAMAAGGPPLWVEMRQGDG